MRKNCFVCWVWTNPAAALGAATQLDAAAKSAAVSLLLYTSCIEKPVVCALYFLLSGTAKANSQVHIHTTKLEQWPSACVEFSKLLLLIFFGGFPMALLHFRGFQMSARKSISNYDSNSSSPGSTSSESSGSRDDSGMEVESEVDQVMGPLDANSQLKDVVEAVNAIRQRTHK